MGPSAKHILNCESIENIRALDREKIIDLIADADSDYRNIKIELKKFTNPHFTVIPRLKDLLEIASYIYLGDRKTFRGAANSLSQKGWDRTFEIHIRVRDLDFWNKDVVKKKLSKALEFMTGDKEYEFVFYKKDDDFPESIFDNENFEMEISENIKVALFSGGLDSLAGILESLETTDEKICLVSHRSGQPSVANTQNELYNSLNARYNDRLEHYKFKCNLTNESSRDETQRTRSFLYTSIAFMIAKTLGQNEIYIYENGITSINLPEIQSQMNARNSRTTHPKTLFLLEQLFTEIGEAEFKIINPFILKTKTQVVDIIKGYDRIDLLESSVTCSRTRSGGKKHCGVCSQCLDRIFACYALEIYKDDNGERYITSIARDKLTNEQLDVLGNFLKQIIDFKNFGLDDFYDKYLSELEDIELYIEGEREEERIEKIYNLTKEQSRNVEIGYKNLSEKNKAPLEAYATNTIYRFVGNLLTVDGKEIKNEQENLNSGLQNQNKTEIGRNGKIEDLAKKLRYILKQKDEDGETNFDHLIKTPQKERYGIFEKLLHEHYPKITDEMIIASKETIERYLKESKLIEYMIGKKNIIP